MLDKAEFRAKARKSAKQYVGELTVAQSRIASQNLLTNFDIFFNRSLLDESSARISSIGSYQPMGDEIDVALLDKVCKNRNITVAYPVWKRDGEWLEQMHFESDSKLVTPQWILLPVLAVNHLGYRLGRGKGYYDKYLAKHPAVISIGIGWDHQYYDRVGWSVDAWDMPMRHYLSPKLVDSFDLNPEQQQTN